MMYIQSLDKETLHRFVGLIVLISNIFAYFFYMIICSNQHTQCTLLCTDPTIMRLLRAAIANCVFTGFWATARTPFQLKSDNVLLLKGFVLCNGVVYVVITTVTMISNLQPYYTLHCYVGCRYPVNLHLLRIH